MSRIFSSVKVWRQSFGQHLSKMSVLYIEQVHLNTCPVEPAGHNSGSTASEMKCGSMEPYLSPPLLLESWKLEKKPSREMKGLSEQLWTIKLVQSLLFSVLFSHLFPELLWLLRLNLKAFVKVLLFPNKYSRFYISQGMGFERKMKYWTQNVALGGAATVADIPFQHFILSYLM